MLRLALLLLVFTLPGSILAAIITAWFPHIPLLVLIIMDVFILYGLAQAYLRRRRNYYVRNNMADQMPEWLNKKSYMGFLVVGTILSAIFTHEDSQANLYIDNGADEPITIELSRIGKITIPAHDFVQKEVAQDVYEGVIDGRKVKLDIEAKGNWIWNINQQNTYIVNNVHYLSSSGMQSEMEEMLQEINSDADEVSVKLINKEFFQAQTDYVFSAPENISIKKNRYSSKGPTKKTVLQHYKRKPNKVITGEESATPPVIKSEE